MDELIKYFTTNLTGDKVWLGLACLVIFYIIKKEPLKVIAHFSEKRIKELEFAKVLLDSKTLGDEANQFIKEHLE